MGGTQGKKVTNMSAVKACISLQSLCVRSCLLKKIKGIKNLTRLTSIEFYDNKIKKLKGFKNLVNLVVLDVSFNNIKVSFKQV